jgi:cytochrome c-type biogenesis protein CcmH
MKAGRLFLALSFIAFTVAPALAVNPDEVLKDPVLEARARAISTELRCLVCQNQSIDISDAGLARDLRIIVRERLTSGDTDAEVIDYVVARYGEFVLLKPRFSAANALLWLAPMGLILIGALVLFRSRRRAAENKTPDALSKTEEAKLAEIIARQDRPPV